MKYLWGLCCFFISTTLFSLPNLRTILYEAIDHYPQYSLDTLLVVDIPTQKMYMIKNGSIHKEYIISTGKGGVSSRIGSKGTPTGWHRIWMKIGDDEPIGRNIYYKKVTPVIVPIHTDDVVIEGDYQTTRVLPLEGLQKGLNRGEGIDSVERGINIHGTPEEGRLGRPVSRGCIRLKNTEVIELYNQVLVNTLVYIVGE